MTVKDVEREVKLREEVLFGEHLCRKPTSNLYYCAYCGVYEAPHKKCRKCTKILTE